MCVAQDLCMRCCGFADGLCFRSGYVMDALCPFGVQGTSVMVFPDPYHAQPLVGSRRAHFVYCGFCVCTRISGKSTRACVYTRLCAYTMISCLCIHTHTICVYTRLCAYTRFVLVYTYTHDLCMHTRTTCQSGFTSLQLNFTVFLRSL